MNENYHTETEELKHAEEINEVLFRISNAVNTTKDLSQLYATIHQALAKIIDVTNFYIALYDSEKRTLHFPYYKDEIDENFRDLVVDYDVSDSLTGQVIIDKEAVLLDRKELLERKAQNRLQGPVPLAWLGVPLIADNKVIGVMAVQSYTNPHIFTEKDVKVLASVSEQVALAIDRKRAHEALIESEKRFREIADMLPTILCELDKNLLITYMNRLGMEVFGITPAHLKSGLNIRKLFRGDADDEERVSILLNDILKGEKIEGTEFYFRKKDKGEMVGLVYTSPIMDAGEVIGARLNVTDITERKKAEEERNKLILELQETLSEIKTLKGIIPICASCKRIRDDKGYWNQVEAYIRDHSEADFSHSICPDCMKKLYPDLIDNDNSNHQDNSPLEEKDAHH